MIWPEAAGASARLQALAITNLVPQSNIVTGLLAGIFSTLRDVICDTSDYTPGVFYSWLILGHKKMASPLPLTDTALLFVYTTGITVTNTLPPAVQGKYLPRGLTKVQTK